MKKLTVKFLALALALLMLVGCSSGQKESTSAPGSSTQAQEGTSMKEDAAKHFENGKLKAPITTETVTYNMVYKRPPSDVGSIEDKYEAFFKVAESLGIKFEVEEIDENSWVIDALGHNTTPHDAVNATCTTAGNSAYWTCSACGRFFSARVTRSRFNKAPT